MKKLKMILAAPAIVAFFTLFQIETQAQVIEKTETITKQSNDSVLFFIDGNKVTEEDVQKLSPDSIGSVNVIKNQETLKEHGNTSANGSIYITTKNDDSKITSHTFSGNYIYMVDGKVVTADEFTKASQKTNKEINIVQNSNYAKDLGYDGKDGVFILTTKVDSAPVKIIEEVKYNGKTISMDELITSDLNTQENRTFEFKFKKEEDIKNILYILNGKEISETDFRTIQPDDIESVTVLKDKNATEKYGAKGKDGVLLITTKTKKSALLESKAKILKDRELALKRRNERTAQRAAIEKKQKQLLKKRDELKNERIAKEKGLQVSVKSNSKTNKNLKQDFKTVSNLFYDVKKDVKNLEDEHFKITNITTSLKYPDGQEIKFQENY